MHLTQRHVTGGPVFLLPAQGPKRPRIRAGGKSKLPRRFRCCRPQSTSRPTSRQFAVIATVEPLYKVNVSDLVVAAWIVKAAWLL